MKGEEEKQGRRWEFGPHLSDASAPMIENERLDVVGTDKLVLLT